MNLSGSVARELSAFCAERVKRRKAQGEFYALAYPMDAWLSWLTHRVARVDAHVIQPREYEEIPELTEETLTRGQVNKGGRPRSPNPRKLISIRLPEQVIERWRATGPGWQTRMADRLSKVQPK